MKFVIHIALIGGLIGLTACSEPPPPRSVSEFMDNSNLLEAALVRCTRDREKSRYDAECINAREAVRVGEAEFRRLRRTDLEAESQRKRDALRRTQWAAAEARRRAVEAIRLREEAEYLAQFGGLPPAAAAADEAMGGNVPMAIVPQAVAEGSVSVDAALALPTTGSNVPAAVIEPEPEPATTEAVPDLEAIREELRRRDDENQ